MFDFLVISESGSINPSNSITNIEKHKRTMAGYWMMVLRASGLHGSPLPAVTWEDCIFGVRVLMGLVLQESIRAGLGLGDSTKN